MKKMAVCLIFMAWFGVGGAAAADVTEHDIASQPLEITAPGTYHITQSAAATDNTISVTTKDDVTLVLDGVNIKTTGSIPVSASGGNLTIELTGENRIAAASTEDDFIHGISNPEGVLTVLPSDKGGSLSVDIAANCFYVTKGTTAGVFCGSFMNEAEMKIAVAGSDGSNCALAAINGDDQSDKAFFCNNGSLDMQVYTASTGSGAFTYAAGVSGSFKEFTNTGSIKADVLNTNKDAYGISYSMYDGGVLSNTGSMELKVTALGGTGEGFVGEGGMSNNSTGIELGCRGAATFENDGSMTISATNRGDGQHSELEYANGISVVGGQKPATITNRGSMKLEATCGYSFGIYAENFYEPVTVYNYGSMDIFATTWGLDNGGPVDPTDHLDLATGIFVVRLGEKREYPMLVLGSGSDTKIVVEAEAGYQVSDDQLQAAVVQQYYDGEPIASALPQIQVEDGLTVTQGGGMVQRFPQEPDGNGYYYTTAFGPDADHYAQSLHIVVPSPRTSIALTLDGQPYRNQEVALDTASDSETPQIAAKEKNGVYTVPTVAGSYYIYVNGRCINPDTPFAVGEAGAETTVAYYTLSFDLNGGDGTVPDRQVLLSGQKPAVPAAPSRSGYSFAGWETKATGGDVFSFEQGVTSTTRVYASWKKSSSSGSGGSSTDSSTTTQPDGSTTTTVTDKTTGTVIETTKTPDGAVTQVEKTTDGTVTTTEKQTDGTQVKTVATPEQVTAEVAVPHSGTKTEVTIPVPAVTPGTVAVLVKEDGTKEIVRDSLPTEDGVAVTLTGNAKLEIIDNSKPFADVTEDAWYAPAVDFTTARELLKGTGEETFSPALPTTRAMVVTMLYRLENEPDAANVDFTDIRQADWYSDAVAWAAASKVVEGVGEKQFAPEKTITRQELAVMLYRYAGYPAPPNLALDFADAGQVSGYAADALRWAIDQGIVTGKPGNRLDPKGDATRAEVAVMLQRYLVKK